MRQYSRSSKFIFTASKYKSALIAAFFFGCVAPGTKAFSSQGTPQSTAGLLYLSAGLSLFFVLAFQNRLSDSLFQFKKKDLKWLGLATFMGGILGPAFLTYGLLHLSGSTASLLLNLEAVMTSLIAWFVLKEHFEKKIVYGMILIVIGSVILSINSEKSTISDSWIGFLLIGLACLSWGIDNNVTRNISHLDAVMTAAIKGLLAGSSNIFLGFVFGEHLSLNFNFLGIAFLGILGIGVSLVSFIKSLASIGTSRTGAVFSTAPVVGSIIAILILNEPFTMSFAISLTFMIAGVWLHFGEDHSHEHTHYEIEHAHIHSHDEHHNHVHDKNDPNGEPHTHLHRHERLTHAHPHFPDIHHQHEHA